MLHSTPKPAKTSSKLPKYQKIKAYIIEGINSHSFTNELPSENKLAGFFGVSRMTARKAMDELEREGQIVRINGKGSFVKKQKHYSGFFRVRPFKQWAADLGSTTSVKLLQAGVIETPHNIAGLLDFPPQIIHIERLTFLDDMPVRLSRHYIRIDVAAGILMNDLEQESIQELLSERYNVDITKISQDLLAINLPTDIAGLFDVPPGYAAFHFKRLELTGETPVCYVEYFMRGELAFQDIFSPKMQRSLSTA